MYPWIRLAREMFRARRLPPLGYGEVHSATIRCMPWDIDMQMEMNNGRIITLFDLVRVPMFQRMGVLDGLADRKWFGMVLGSSIRYRRRITLFQKLELRSRTLGVDDRFFYIEHGIFRDGECCAHALVRTGMTTGKGIIPTQEVLDALNYEGTYPIPDWVRAWAEAEAQRPWPPMQDEMLQAAE